MKEKVDERRIYRLNNHPIGNGPIIYWMSRDQRAHNNWALSYAQQLAEHYRQPLAVVFCLVPHFLEATIRQYGFMLRGLQELEPELAKYGIPFQMLLGEPPRQIISFAESIKAGGVVTDFDPLRIKKGWRSAVAQSGHFAVHEVDAHNIVPCRIASPKQEFGAYTLRPKINRVLPEYLTSFPKLRKQEEGLFRLEPTDWEMVWKSLRVDASVPEVDWLESGEKAAARRLKNFISNQLPSYEEGRNDPTKNAQSNLSPYLHFGQISAQQVALEIKNSTAPVGSKEAFLEELIVRRELSDNFCWYNEVYDSFEGFPAWAKKTLREHWHDQREYLYSCQEFESARTHDPLWNAAQTEMVKTGKMHGYLRMYWAKKILEWSSGPDEALRIAIYLNDKYELDGRDPNGYVGIAWSIGGVHDRAWFKRNIFGLIRYMARSGCDKKFDTKKYIDAFSS